MDRPYDETLAHVRTCSRPSELKITDIRFAHITAASSTAFWSKFIPIRAWSAWARSATARRPPMPRCSRAVCSARTPATWIACSRKIKAVRRPEPPGGGVSGLEIALWDLAGRLMAIRSIGCWGQVPRLRADSTAIRAERRPPCVNPIKTPNQSHQRAHGSFSASRCARPCSAWRMWRSATLMRIFLIAPPDFLDSILHKPENAAATDPSPAAKVLDKPAERKMNDYLYTEHPYTMLRVTDRSLDHDGTYRADARGAGLAHAAGHRPRRP